MSIISTPDNFYCELTNQSIIRVTGEQTDTYLQGQVSVNMQRLTLDHAMLTCHCDFKGKLWNVGYLVRHQNGVDFQATKGSEEATLRELKKYGVFSKVTIDIAQTKLIGCYGPDAEAALRSLFGDLSKEHLGLAQHNDGWCLTITMDGKRCYLVSLSEYYDEFISLLATVNKCDEPLWNVLAIASGIANITSATQNEFVPQMFNLQALDAIDFKKGCYMGQEVVARTKYLGKNKRALYLLRIENGAYGSNLIPPGATLELSIGENWRRGGTIVRSDVIEQGGWMLAVLPHDTNVGDRLRVKDSPEIMCTVEPLPYIINE